MAFDLGMIPTALINDVFGKMDLTTLSRMRQTNSNVNAFVEQNRNRIKVWSSFPSILKISVDSEKMALVYKVAYKELEDHETLDLLYYLGQISEEEFRIVEAPLEQLSIAKFDYIFINFDLQGFRENEPHLAANLKQQASVVDGILSQLDHLRLQCDWLCLQTDNYSTQLVMEILSKIYFKKISFKGPCLTRDVDRWPIQHCQQIHLAGLDDVPKRIAPFLSIPSIASISFTCHEGVENMMRNFLLEIKENPSLIVNLKGFHIKCVDLHKLDGIEGMEEIYAYYDEENFLSISKLKIGEGFVYLTYVEDRYALIFAECECDAEIVDSFCYAKKLVDDVEN